MFVFVLLCITCVHSWFSIILKRKRKLVLLLLLSCGCIGTVNVLWLFLTVPWVGLQYVFVVFPDHLTYFLRLESYKIIEGYTIHLPLRYKRTILPLRSADIPYCRLLDIASINAYEMR